MHVEIASATAPDAAMARAATRSRVGPEPNQRIQPAHVPGGRDLGDLRIWRARQRPDFGQRDLDILDALCPFLRRALLRMDEDDCASLTLRERQVATLVAEGCRDREIAHRLGIGFGTVRTHLNRAMEKLDCANRAELAVSVSGGGASHRH